MKTVLLVTAAPLGGAVYAHASEAFSDPSDLRGPGVTDSISAVTIKPADGGSNGQDPFGMRTRGVAFASPSTQLANQPVHRTQPRVHAHAPTVTNANPNG